MSRALIAVGFAVSFVASVGCATAPEARSRPDDALTRLFPSRHSIAPVHPSAGGVKDAASPDPTTTTASRFAAESITLEEPTFHELHSLAWQREVKAYTAAVLNDAASPLPAGAPLETRVRFTWTFDHRDSMVGAERVAIAVESVLPDGRVVTSADTSAEVAMWNEAGPETAFAISGAFALGAALGVDVVLLLLQATASPIGWAALGVAVVVATGATAVAVGLNVARVAAVQERWSDLYLVALRWHAADVRRVLVDGGVPAIGGEADASAVSPLEPLAAPPSE